jgi:hypothetical protein
MVQVTAGRGAAATRRRASGVAGPDQVLEGAAGVVADLCVRVVAGTAGDRDHANVEGTGGPGAGREMPTREAAVGGGGAVGVHRGEAPPGAGVAGRGGHQVAGVVAVQRAESVGLPRPLGPALQGGPGNRDGDQRRDARPGSRAWLESRTGTAGAVLAGVAFPPRVAFPARPIRSVRSLVASSWACLAGFPMARRGDFRRPARPGRTHQPAWSRRGGRRTRRSPPSGSRRSGIRSAERRR